MPENYSLLEHLLFPPTRLNMSRVCAELKGKTILITGASFGIGEELARMLAPTGAHLILVGRTTEKLEAVKAEVERLGGNASIFSADLRDPEAMAGLIAYLQALPDGIDIFVSNAGKSIRRSIFDSLDRMHDFERTMALNYHAPVQLCLALIPFLEQRKGQIINVSAINVLLAPAPKWAAYQASKTAFDQWFRSAAPELNVRGIATSSIYLPLVKTRMMEPTESYRNMPAMRTLHVARIICKYMYTRRARHKPWWLIFMELGGVIFPRLWGLISRRTLQKSRS